MTKTLFSGKNWGLHPHGNTVPNLKAKAQKRNSVTMSPTPWQVLAQLIDCCGLYGFLGEGAEFR